jgi:thioredoxin reductase (NADPH)
VHQFDTLQANKVAQAKIKEDPKVEILFEHEPREFKKYGTMDMGVVVEDLKTKERRELRTHGIFVFVGFLPNIEGLSDELELDQWGYLQADDEMKTSIDGVYAVGDVKTKAYRQITTAVADGTIAAIAITKTL